MAQIIASTKEISNKRESLIVLSNSLKNKNLLKTILEFILILEKIIAIYNKAEKKNEATAVS